MQAGARVTLFGGTVALAFALISLRAHSVGWLFSCAAASVNTIVALIFGVIGLAGGTRGRAAHVLGLILGLGAAVLMFYSYRHVSAHGGI
ncbi:MAG TPA: hypothetical protein VFT72_11645 [Opitutaceae bacterium]|nr:hypothetical protein [Opitutaceae bacterium]